MSLDFLNSNCKEPSRTDKLFGLCDDQNGTKAYSNVDQPDNWIATVKNDNEKELVFTPVDKCIIRDNEYPGRGRCDGILTSSDHLYFVELKDEDRNWKKKTIRQLESTIEFFKENHDINMFKHKKAFGCNRRRRAFEEIETEQNLAFFRKHKVRIDLQAEILVV